jgi:PilZ domain
VAGPQQTPWEEGTEIRDLSLSGLAFLAPDDMCPVLGEPMRVQFDVPGAGAMACFAIVTRIENQGSQCLVAVRFARLEAAQKIYLTQNLRVQVREQQEQNSKLEIRKRLRLGYKKVLAILFLLAGWALINWFWFYVIPELTKGAGV